MAAILNMTSMAIDATAKMFEAGSFALVGLLGLYLLVRKGRAAWAAMHGGDPHAHHHHYDHSRPRIMITITAMEVTPIRTCGRGGCTRPRACPRSGDVEARPLRRAAAIVSVGMRPCSGALIVLVFALAQGVFWAGVASTFLMALGTAITVAALAALAVGAKDIARFIARGDDRRGGQIMLALELAAAAFITRDGRGALSRDALQRLSAERLTRRELDRLAVRRALGRLAPCFLQIDEVGRATRPACAPSISSSAASQARQ